ncbi:leucine Rich Repeat domain protein, putative [Trichomonas vaginalis G3]|uniref:Leucine Rich Repeat domain protein, putative n=1 Tax=Trichomonas vaginalis (strain ATCC PRA-98 / G3) TaxID=412133 RepID=A2DWC5_TRIV3|nr:ribonuclease inhibitor domain-containing protein [Trichomonas vaginalis G3]EAY15265.1 leucine Rich Repeat domain protein, putative [Trichomonas vaginalis G3]KAI5526421.1 ribonuclease inhibitor domain-containing protein [Trichomonas vaginalis G3]|eukprot:XP_001327488.1 leucine Rich Repeat domain protein [Trichomonas vaginalis G3]
MFAHCVKLTNSVFENIGIITEIQANAFSGCSDLNLNWYSFYSIKIIGDNAFSGNNVIADLLFSPTLEEIGNAAFQNVYALRTVRLPPKMTKIGQIKNLALFL